MPKHHGLATIDMHPLNELRKVGKQTGDPEFYHRIVGKFAGMMHTNMEQLCEAFAQNDAKQVSFYAHRIKGGSMTVGAKKLHDLSNDLEQELKSGVLNESCEQLRDELKVELELVLDFFNDTYH